ncbi:MAG: threonylcarbamoyl-AMP synthase [Chitinophagaceae bacterium]|nr:threonylcarbamoyl-AMP synthase [Chitinophagaceae bacterium]
MLLKIYPDNPDEKKIKQVVECLKDGGVIIYPTDTIYGLGCDIYKKNAIERICRIKNIDVKKAQFSFICSDLSHLSQYAKSSSTPIFRLLKNNLPGPFTFILPASKEVPKLLIQKKQTVGIRVPQHQVCQHLIKALGNPIISTSLIETEWIEEMTDPELIYEKYKNQVDIVIDSGVCGFLPSTIVDCTSDVPEIIRQSLGELII